MAKPELVYRTCTLSLAAYTVSGKAPYTSVLGLATQARLLLMIVSTA